MTFASSLRAQSRIRFPTPPAAGVRTTVYQSGTFSQPGTGIAPPAGVAAPSSLGAPAFDAYSANPSAASLPPTFNTSPSPYGSTMPPAAAPAGTLSSPGMPAAVPYGAPAGAPYGVPPGATAVPPYGAAPAPPYGAAPAAPYGAAPAAPYGGYPAGAAPNAVPSSLYPNGWAAPNWAMPSTQLLTPRLRYTYIDGGNAANDLGINDFDSSVVVAFPNFLYSTQPLYVVPSFSLHLWQGPRPPFGDLPANAYSAFLDLGWSSDPAQPFGGEIGVRGGAFSDFNTFTTNSWRIMGQGLFRLRTTPAVTLRGGVVYINRNKLKLLPAFGLLWTPNSKTRFDIYFPRPKLAQQLTTVGNNDVWWYVGGEYGGGAWTVERTAGFSDRIDINDVRLMLGVEWGQGTALQQGRRKGFAEVGWVTNREVVYVVTPSTMSMRDSFMLRIGWNY